MSATSNKYEVKIYIEPKDGGPIKPLKLDMLEVEKSVEDLGLDSNRDEERVKYTVECIEKAFPGIDPYGNLAMIRHFVTRFSHVTLFSGVVLSLPGTIQEDPQNPMNDPALVGKLERERDNLIEEIGQLRDKLRAIQNDPKEETRELMGKLQALQKKYDEDMLKMPLMEKQGEDYVKKFEVLERRIKGLQEDFNNASDGRDKAVIDAQRAKARESALDQENAALLVKEEQAQRERRAYKQAQDELADLRVERDGLLRENTALRTALDKCGQENRQLKDQQQRLAEQQQPKQPADPVKPDQAKNEWIV